MKPRFYWDAERIAFFRDAAENSAFYRLLAERISLHLCPEDRVLDAGCGLGYLSEALLPFCKSVTAVDRDEAAVSELRRRAGTKPGLYPAAADVNDIPLPFDAIVCCRFGSTEDALALLERSEARVLILVKRNEEAHRFSEGAEVHTRTAAGTEQRLVEKGIPFSKQTVSLSLDQPFRSEADADRFFDLYRGKAAESKEREARFSRLIKTGDPQFPLVLPVSNDLTLFFIQRWK